VLLSILKTYSDDHFQFIMQRVLCGYYCLFIVESICWTADVICHYSSQFEGSMDALPPILLPYVTFLINIPFQTLAVRDICFVLVVS
jgi:hypothetical protein